eukprot:TRINITY_DN45423_c0_g1_i1.p3 TRINITY_DN45423_c0_g1~~TRINITY_DN45423_c0_g1_i1.p3  ORF type:complete len:140 (-),score=4.21 TRINITY_DN45423_c0_g1_i1:79-498(-)
MSLRSKIRCCESGDDVEIQELNLWSLIQHTYCKCMYVMNGFSNQHILSCSCRGQVFVSQQFIKIVFGCTVCELRNEVYLRWAYECYLLLFDKGKHFTILWCLEACNKLQYAVDLILILVFQVICLRMKVEVEEVWFGFV